MKHRGKPLLLLSALCAGALAAGVLCACSNKKTVTVIFHADGNEDIVIFSKAGKPVAPPEVPEKPGNWGYWDYDGDWAIEQNMTIRATYETKNLHYTLNNEKNAYIVDRGMMASETSELYIPCEYSGRPVEEIAERGFYALDLEPEARAIEKIFLPDGLKVIGDFAFTFYSNLSFVSLPDTLAYLGKSAFVSTNLQDITIPKNVNEIGSDAFSGCENLKSVDFQCTSPTMGNSVFDYCSSLISVNLPENLQTIPDYTFRSCRSLPTINIPNRVTAIGKGAFYNCRSLQSVRIPANVAEVGESAFYWCSSLRSVDIATPSKLKTMSKDMFRFCNDV